jgi:hypothetical protein
MSLSNYWTGGEIKDGKLVLDDAYAFKTAMWRMKPGRVSIAVEQEKDRRSVAANRYYWGIVVKLIAQETGQDPQDIHDDLRDRFLRKTVTYVDRRTGLIQERTFSRGSSGLTVSEFYEFVEHARLFAAEFFGMRIPDPDPEYRQQRAAAMETEQKASASA